MAPNLDMPEAKKPRGRPPKVKPVESQKQQDFPMRVGGVYKMTDSAIVTDTEGKAVLMSIVPFEVMKVTKNLIAVRFPFGGIEVHRITTDGVILGGAEYSVSKSFAEHEGGLFQ